MESEKSYDTAKNLMEFNQSAWSSDYLKSDSQGSEISDNEHGYYYKQKEKSEEDLRDFFRWSKGEESTCQCRFNPGWGRSYILWSN